MEMELRSGEKKKGGVDMRRLLSCRRETMSKEQEQVQEQEEQGVRAGRGGGARLGVDRGGWSGEGEEGRSRRQERQLDNDGTTDQRQAGEQRAQGGRSRLDPSPVAVACML